jgi:hypothetical protein
MGGAHDGNANLISLMKHLFIFICFSFLHISPTGQPADRLFGFDERNLRVYPSYVNEMTYWTVDYLIGQLSNSIRYFQDAVHFNTYLSREL